MALKVNSDIALTGSLTVSGSYGLAAADIPSLAASKITSGTFAAARIPSLAASKITSGTFADARIASAANWNTAYGWGNHASAGYSTFDGAYDSLTGRPTIPTNNNQLTNGAGYVTSSGNTVIGTDSDINTSGFTVIDNLYMTDGVITSHGSRSLLNVHIEDTRAAEKVPNDYLDKAVSFDFSDELDSLGAWYSAITLKGWSDGYNAWQLIANAANNTTDQNLYFRGGTGTTWGTLHTVYHSGNLNPFTGASVSNDTITFTKADGTTTSVTTSDANTNYYLNGISKSGNTLTFSVNGTTNQSYTFGSLAFSSATYDNYGSWNLKTGGTQRTTVGSGGDLDIVGGTNVTVAYSAGGVVTISSTDTNTTYTVGDGGLTQKNFTTTLKNKLDGIASSADAYGGWNISDGTNSEKIQANNTLTVQGGGSASVSYDSGNNTLTVNATDTNTTYSVGDGGLTQKNFTTTLKNKLDGIAANANNYSLPAGSSSVRGGFKIGYTESGKNYPVEVSNEQMYVNVPWTDNNTTYSTATSSTLGLVKIGYTENGKNYPVELSSGQMYVNVPWTDTNTTYSVGDGGLTQVNFTTARSTKLDGIAEGANAYSLPAGSSSTRGGFKIGYAENGKNYPVEVSSEKMYVNVPWTDTNTNTITSVGVSGSETTGTVTLAASGAASVSQVGSTVTISATNTTYSEYTGSSAGLVPAGSGGTGKFLQEDGTWAIPQDSNTTYSAGAGLDLTGTTFSVESNLAGDVYTIGRDGNDKYTVNTTNHAWYLDGVLDMRLNNDGNLDVDGDVIAYSTVTSSDRKLKTDIKTLENACEKVCNLRGVSFTWDHGRKTGKKDIGLIAQEVEEVVPEIVGEAELLDGTMAKHVDYPKLVALLIEANKELCDRISNLEAKLNGITE